MSTLRNYNWEHEILFNDGSTTHLFIENPIIFRSYIIDICAQVNGDEGDFVLSESNKEIPMSKNMCVITDPIEFKFDEKKINTKITKDLLSIISREPEKQEEARALISLLEKFASSLVGDYGFNIDYERPEDSAIVKMLNFHICTDYENSTEKLVEYMNINQDILGIENFVIVNACTVFSKEELESLERACVSLKHNLLFIDRYNIYDKKPCIIIDPDGCEVF